MKGITDVDIAKDSEAIYRVITQGITWEECCLEIAVGMSVIMLVCLSVCLSLSHLEGVKTV